MEESYDEIDGDFKVIKALGKGYTSKVLLTIHKKSGTQVAIKIYKQRKQAELLEADFENEVTTMRKVSHPNVLKIYAANNEGTYVFNNNRKNPKQIIYLGVEVCPNGELFDYIKDAEKGLNERIARYYFRQIIEGIAAIHNAGLAHRDLKLENMFLDSKYNVKIGDFGFAKFIKGSNLISHLGTAGYQSPQMVLGRDYNGFENDIFAAGVILFVLHSGSPPFREASGSDPWYKNYLAGSSHIFWNYHLRHFNFSKSFMKLMDGMLAPTGRSTISEIMKSEWYNEEAATEDEVIKEMDVRRIIVRAEREKEKIELDLESDEFNPKKTNKTYRDDSNKALSMVEEEQKLGTEIDDDQIITWAHDDNEAGSYLKLKLPTTKAYWDIAYILAKKYPYIEFEFNTEALKLSATFDENKNKDESTEVQVDLEKLNISSISLIDINVQIFKSDRECSSVLQLYKNEQMSQFDFRNLYRQLRAEFH